jgi:hypothetical protein
VSVVTQFLGNSTSTSAILATAITPMECLAFLQLQVKLKRQKHQCLWILKAPFILYYNMYISLISNAIFYKELLCIFIYLLPLGSLKGVFFAEKEEWEK